MNERGTWEPSAAMPPAKGASDPIFVPKTDSDGRDIAGAGG
jgi:hypothetical protein